MEFVALVARIALAITFAISAVAKIRDADGARQAVRDFGVPSSVAPLVAMSLAPLEIASAVLLLTTDAGVTAGGLLALALLAAFTIGIVTNLLRGKRVDCHCFGAMSTKPLSWWSVVRNVVMMALALVVLAGGTTQGWPWQVVADTFADLSTAEAWLTAAVMALALAVAALALLFFSLLQRYGSLLLRLEAVEAGGAGGHAHGHGHAHEFAAWAAPALAATDASGAELSLDDIVPDDRASLFVFVAPWCEACGELIEDLKEWQADDVRSERGRAQRRRARRHHREVRPRRPRARPRRRADRRLPRRVHARRRRRQRRPHDHGAGRLRVGRGPPALQRAGRT